MARFVRNLAGVIHSVADHFDLDAREGWEEVTEEIAKAEHGHLFGDPDPAVEAVRAHDGAGNPVEFTVTGNPAPVAATPVPEVVSTEPTGKTDGRKIEPTPTPADTAAKGAEVTA